MPRCNASKADGTPCQAIVKQLQQLCHAHDPARADQRRRAASKAGRSRTGGELPAIKARLKEIAEDVLADKITTGKGSVAAQVYGVLLRAIEQERKQRETEELAVEVRELRELVDNRSDQGAGAWG